MGSLPNIVWITVESMRADHTSLSEYSRDTTPNLKRIAEADEGTLFSNCFSHSLWTPASSASILTGTYMSYHNVGMDGTGKRALPDDIATVPELLREQGYHTACISPLPWISSATGLDRGFEQFVRLSPHSENPWEYPIELLSRVNWRHLLSYALHLSSDGPGLSLDPQNHNLSYIMKEMAKKWVTDFNSSKEPYFLYLHLPNPHHPYTPPRGLLDHFSSDLDMPPEDALQLSLDVFKSHSDMKRRIANGCDFTEDEWNALISMYDTELFVADSYIGELFSHLQSNEKRDVDFVVTSDHGEYFGEFGLLGHNLVLSDPITHVPLITYGLFEDENRTDELVQHIDVIRTLCEKVGCRTDQFQGFDLRTDSRNYCLSQRGIAHFDNYLMHNSEFDMSAFDKEPVNSLRSPKFRFSRSESTDRFYELPDERTDVSDSHPEAKEEMKKELDTQIERISSEITQSKESEFTDEMKNHLSDLGYL